MSVVTGAVDSCYCMVVQLVVISKGVLLKYWGGEIRFHCNFKVLSFLDSNKRSDATSRTFLERKRFKIPTLEPICGLLMYN